MDCTLYHLPCHCIIGQVYQLTGCYSCIKTAGFWLYTYSNSYVPNVLLVSILSYSITCTGTSNICINTLCTIIIDIILYMCLGFIALLSLLKHLMNLIIFVAFQLMLIACGIFSLFCKCTLLPLFASGLSRVLCPFYLSIHW